MHGTPWLLGAIVALGSVTTLPPGHSMSPEQSSQAVEVGTQRMPGELGVIEVLPLPGKYGGAVLSSQTSGVKIHGIALLQGEDQTKNIISAANPQLPKGDSDIYLRCGVDDHGYRSFMLFSLPTLPMSFKDRLGYFDFLAALQSGRVLRLIGTLEVPVADPVTKTASKRLVYEFDEGATVNWDVKKKGLVWRGFSVRLLDVQ